MLSTERTENTDMMGSGHKPWAWSCSFLASKTLCQGSKRQTMVLARLAARQELGGWTDILGVWFPKHRMFRVVRRRSGWEESSVSKVHALQV